MALMSRGGERKLRVIYFQNDGKCTLLVKMNLSENPTLIQSFRLHHSIHLHHTITPSLWPITLWSITPSPFSMAHHTMVHHTIFPYGSIKHALPQFFFTTTKPGHHTFTTKPTHVVTPNLVLPCLVTRF